MSTGTETEKNSGSPLRDLPSVDALLKTETAERIASEGGRDLAVRLAREAVDELRSAILNEGPTDFEGGPLTAAEFLLERRFLARESERLGRVINATGVIVHTNLGRSPLSEGARSAMLEAAGYCPLEFDLETGERGRRGAAAERMIAELTGAEEALVVNNCAAAAVLVLNSLCDGGEAVVSRGELVEIGGDFRVPDVMERSGATLVEVGTTNRTRTADYEAAITENTRLLVKVHPSNYRIVGFTSSPVVSELADLARRKGILFYEDAGSGALVDLSEYGLDDEPLITESIKAGTDVVTFSGDKLLGGPQSGIIAGKREIVGRIRKNPLYRALRPSKIIYAALEGTLRSFAKGSMFEEVPALRMLRESVERLGERSRRVIDRTNGSGSGAVSLEIIEGQSVVGGGSAPDAHRTGPVIAVTAEGRSVNELLGLLRKGKPPVIARIADEKLVIDLRTVDEAEEDTLVEALKRLC